MLHSLRTVLAALLLSAGSPAPGQLPQTPAPEPPPAEPAAPQTAIPDSPAGGHLRWAIEAFNGGELGDLESRFTPEFLAQVPAEQLTAVIAQLRAGPFKGRPVKLADIRDGATPLALTAGLVAEADGARFNLFVRVHEPSGKMEGLLIRPAAAEVPRLASFEELDAELTRLPGRVNCGVFRLSGDPSSVTLVHGLNTDSRLALGSTFKLYILGALAELVEAGEASWDEPLPIREEHKSLPSGKMQLHPAGAEFPISHYADQMISISDNTATDHLLHRAGRERVETYMARLNSRPELNRPFLSTMEMFRIKLADDRTLPQRYADADEQARRGMIAPGGEVASATPNLILAAAWKKPVEVERVEWFATPEDLARLMADLRAKEQRDGQAPLGHALRINPGVVIDRKVWPGVAYKGGSEPGVISGTWLLTRADGADFVVTVSWTNPDAPVEEGRWVGLCEAAINLAAGAPGE